MRAANLVLHKLPDPPVSFPFQQRDRFLTDVCTGLPPFSLFDLQSGWIASLYYFPPLLSSLNHVLDSCSSPPHPSFLFEPRLRFDYRSKKIHMHLEQRRFQRNLYLRVIGMWQGVRREAGLFENPTISVGVVCGPSEGTVDLTYPIQNFV